MKTTKERHPPDGFFGTGTGAFGDGQELKQFCSGLTLIGTGRNTKEQRLSQRMFAMLKSAMSFIPVLLFSLSSQMYQPGCSKPNENAFDMEVVLKKTSVAS